MANKKVMEFDLFKALEEQYKEKTKIVNINGSDVIIKVDEGFKPSKISEMIKTTIQYIAEAREKEVNINEHDLVTCMIATTFSNIPVKINSVLDVVHVINGLIDLKDNEEVSLLAHIFSMVDEEEVLKINEELARFSDNIKLRLSELEEKAAE